MRKLKVPHLDFERILVIPSFITNNNLSIKSQDELSTEFDKNDQSFFGFRSEVLSQFMNFNTAKKHLIDERVEKGESDWTFISSIEEAAQDFLDYMNFAWGKSVNQRGLSASRSIDKLSAYLWVLNREDLSNLIDNDDLYNPYGAPALITVCNKMGIPVPEELIDFSNNKIDW